MLQITELSKTLGSFALKGVSLSIADGEYFIILGPTGAGKTILLETIAGIHAPDAGSITMDGHEISRMEPKERGVGMVYQDYMLFPHLTVEENIGFGLKQRSIDPAAIRKQVGEATEMLGIGHLLERYPGTLSGGEQQRAAIARALVIKPRILLLDEPLSALDVTTRERLRRELVLIHRRTKITIIHITHHFEDLFALAERAAVMQNGTVVQVGTPEEIFKRPHTEFIANFTGMENLIRGISTVHDTEASIDLGRITVTALTDIEGEVVVGIRPEEVIISAGPIASGARNSYRGVITDIRPNGMFSWVTIDIGEPLTGVLTPQSLATMNLAVGENVYATFKASAVHVFAA